MAKVQQAGTPFDSQVQTYVEEWLEENIVGSKAQNTFKMYQSNKDQLLAFLGYLGWVLLQPLVSRPCLR